MSGAQSLATDFFEALNRGQRDGALALFGPEALFDIVPARVKGPVESQGRQFVQGLLAAFPDLWIQVRSLSAGDGFAVAEVKMEGTQAADFLGILNQEKHVDLDQAWMFWAKGGRLSAVRAYWCQNQLYRRLAVKRLDQISILG